MSASTTYLTTCPSCGAQLTPFAGYPDAAPWGCVPCHRGFWTSELSHEARARYRPQFHDWGHGEDAHALREQVHQERERARQRGTSMLPEQVGMFPKDHLHQIKRLPLHKDFKALVEDALK